MVEISIEYVLENEETLNRNKFTLPKYFSSSKEYFQDITKDTEYFDQSTIAQGPCAQRSAAAFIFK